jgi:hypothetical protein
MGVGGEEREEVPAGHVFDGDAYAAGIASSVSADSGYTIPLVTHP